MSILYNKSDKIFNKKSTISSFSSRIHEGNFYTFHYSSDLVHQGIIIRIDTWEAGLWENKKGDYFLKYVLHSSRELKGGISSNWNKINTFSGVKQINAKD